MSLSRGRRNKKSSRDTLLAAVALQDHFARILQFPGGPTKLPSTEPGADLTLAQQLGLVPKPPRLLTEEQWQQVHGRAREREHSQEECAICREEFKDEQQVLLSCSHVFHRACIISFERYARQRASCCPVCRCAQYQKKIISDGAERYRNKCATRIQKMWRGWLARKRYREMRRHCPPLDPRLRRQWAAERLQEDSNRMIHDMDSERGDLDELFAELDASMAYSRQVCDAMVLPLARRLQGRLQQQEQLVGGPNASPSSSSSPSASGLPGPSSSSGAVGSVYEGGLGGSSGRRSSSSGGGGGGLTLFDVDVYAGTPVGSTGLGRRGSRRVSSPPQPTAPLHSGVGPPPPALPHVDWPAVVGRARARGDEECPICIGPLYRKGVPGVAWLSCSHTFHQDCIIAFEAFELMRGGEPSCPVCRDTYQRRCFHSLPTH